MHNLLWCWFQTSKMGSEHEVTYNAIVEAFLFFDKNGDGKLNRKEMVKAMNEASPWEKSPGHITRKRFSKFLASFAVHGSLLLFSYNF